MSRWLDSSCCQSALPSEVVERREQEAAEVVLQCEREQMRL